MNKIDGKAVAQDILRDVGVIANVMQKRVCFIQFGEDTASTEFIARKQRVAIQMGIQADVIHEVSVTTTEGALSVLEEAITHHYDGIVVQLPLPYGIDVDSILNAIPLAQDIDVLSKESMQLFERSQTERMPPVAGAVNALIVASQIDLIEKNIVLVGLGRLVGAPIAALLDRSNILYQAVTAETPEEEKLALLKDADIVITGTGAPHSIKGSMVKAGVVLIDAGTSEQNGVLVGDIDPSCYVKALLYTPVPGGVGPVTVAILFKNLFS